MPRFFPTKDSWIKWKQSLVDSIETLSKDKKNKNIVESLKEMLEFFQTSIDRSKKAISENSSYITGIVKGKERIILKKDQFGGKAGDTKIRFTVMGNGDTKFFLFLAPWQLTNELENNETEQSKFNRLLNSITLGNKYEFQCKKMIGFNGCYGLIDIAQQVE